MLKVFGTGAYHLAIQLYGREWSFGGTQADVSGVYYAEPRGGEPHKFRKSLYIGSTSLSQSEVYTLLGQLMDLWRGNEYSVLSKNCGDFCDVFVKEMSVAGTQL